MDAAADAQSAVRVRGAAGRRWGASDRPAKSSEAGLEGAVGYADVAIQSRLCDCVAAEGSANGAAGGDRREPHPLEQRDAVILLFLEYAPIELEPGELTINVLRESNIQNAR